MQDAQLPRKHFVGIFWATTWIFICLVLDHIYRITRNQSPLISTAYTVTIIAGAFLIGLLGNTKQKNE